MNTEESVQTGRDASAESRKGRIERLRRIVASGSMKDAERVLETIEDMQNLMDMTEHAIREHILDRYRSDECGSSLDSDIMDYAAARRNAAEGIEKLIDPGKRNIAELFGMDGIKVGKRIYRSDALDYVFARAFGDDADASRRWTRLSWTEKYSEGGKEWSLRDIVAAFCEWLPSRGAFHSMTAEDGSHGEIYSHAVGVLVTDLLKRAEHDIEETGAYVSALEANGKTKTEKAPKWFVNLSGEDGSCELKMIKDLCDEKSYRSLMQDSWFIEWQKTPFVALVRKGFGESSRELRTARKYTDLGCMFIDDRVYSVKKMRKILSRSYNEYLPA